MIKAKLNNKFVLFVSRIFIGIVFIYSGILKISDPQSFSDAVYNYKLLPHISINFIAILLPWIEACTGILLVFGISVKENAFIVLAMVSVFTLAVGISMIRGLDIECGCFGTADVAIVGIQKIIENIFLLILSLYLLVFGSDFLTLNKKQDS